MFDCVASVWGANIDKSAPASRRVEIMKYKVRIPEAPIKVRTPLDAGFSLIT